jgi:uncharacterized protein YecE (DUF72 family)
VRIGTCSWADESLVKAWYPHSARSAESRLRYYCERFDTVEVNSSFYGLPTPEMAAAWARRTPEGFVFHVKAFAMMTRHPVRPEQLPPDLRGEVVLDGQGRVERPSRELRAEVFRRFSQALEPLREAGKLGGILMQFPPYVTLRRQALAYIEWAKDLLGSDEMLVEFRHRSWLEEAAVADVLSFLETRGLTYVIVDCPRGEARNLVPTVVAATTGTAYLRLHGRNAATWNVRGRGAAERFDYLYPPEELEEWVEPLRELREATERAYVMFNNNGRTMSPAGFRAQAPTNALMLREILNARGVPVSEARPGAA